MREIVKATMEDYELASEIYAEARAFMRANNNPTQWGNNRPLPESIKKDISLGRFFLIKEDEQVIGVFTFFIGHDETYDVIREGRWLQNGEYGVIHKVAAGAGAKGILKTALDFALPQVKSLRIDTHRDNVVMQHLLSKYGFTYCGIINTDDGTERLAYENFIGSCK